MKHIFISVTIIVSLLFSPLITQADDFTSAYDQEISTLSNNLHRYFGTLHSCSRTTQYTDSTPESTRPPLLEKYCKIINGTIFSKWNCPHSPEKKVGWYCKVKNEQKQDLIFNGCSRVTGKYADLFFKACVHHDFCYHSDDKFSGKDKNACDLQLLADANQICRQHNGNKILCYSGAYLFYKAVQLEGSQAWSCSKTKAKYSLILSKIQSAVPE